MSYPPLAPAAGRRHSPPPWARRPLLRRETPAIPRRRAAALPSAVGTASPSPPVNTGSPPPPGGGNSPPPWVRRSPSPPGDPGNPPPRGAKGDGIDRLFSCPITSYRFFSASSHFSRIYASGLRILTVLHDFLKNFYCKSRKHFGQLETHLCENYNSKHRDQPGTAGASGWIE